MIFLVLLSKSTISAYRNIITEEKSSEQNDKLITENGPKSPHSPKSPNVKSKKKKKRKKRENGTKSDKDLSSESVQENSKKLSTSPVLTAIKYENLEDNLFNFGGDIPTLPKPSLETTSNHIFYFYLYF